MKKFFPLGIGLIIASLFFYKTILFGHIPFAGDLLLAEYQPWKSASYLGYNPGSYPHKAQYFDTLRQFYPWRKLTTDLLKKGVFPLWNPYNFSGAPLFANHQSSVLYPFNLLYFVLPQEIAWTVLSILQHILAWLFTYLYCRKIKFSLLASIFSSTAYAFSMFFTVFSQYGIVGHTILWLPLILLSIEYLLDRYSPVAFIVLPASIAFSALAGHLQLFGIVMGASVLYATLRLLFQKQKTAIHKPQILFIAAGFILGIALAGVQLVPTLELTGLAARARHDMKFFSNVLLLQPYQLIFFLFPDLFGNPATHNYTLADTYPTNAIFVGVIPFALACFSLLSRPYGVVKKTVIIMVLISLLLIVKTPMSQMFYTIFPNLTASSPSNALFVCSFFLSILAGFGLQDMMTKQNKHAFFRILIFLTSIVVLVWLVKIVGQPLNKTSLYIGSSFIIFLWLTTIGLGRVQIFKKIVITSLILLTTLDLFYYFQKFNPFVPAPAVFPNHEIFDWLGLYGEVDRFSGAGAAGIDANFSSYYRLFSPDGYDPLYPKWYGELIGASKNGKLLNSFDDTNRSDASIARSVMEYDNPDNVYRQKILNLLGVKYIVDREENAASQIHFPPPLFSKVYDNQGWKIYENSSALPRVFLTSRFEVYNSKEEFNKLFFDPAFRSKEIILLDTKPPLAVDPASSTGNASINSYEANFVRISTSAPTNQLLFLSDTYFPGWKAYVDGRQTEILKAHYAFRAVALPPGQHIVEFRYEPASFSIGLKTSMIALVTTALVALYLKRKR